MSALLYPNPNFMVLNFRFGDFLNIRFFNSSVFKASFSELSIGILIQCPLNILADGPKVANQCVEVGEVRIGSDMEFFID